MDRARSPLRSKSCDPDQICTTSLWRLPAGAIVLLLVITTILSGCTLLSTGLSAVDSRVAVALESDSMTESLAAREASMAVQRDHSLAQLATPTPEPGGQVFTVTPERDGVIWWASDDEVGRYVGDSYLYAGYYEDHVFISAIHFDISIIPRGAPIREATLHLTGLTDERLDTQSTGTWSVQFLQITDLDEFTSAGFQEMLNAPAVSTLLPVLYAADLIVGEPNSWTLDLAAREWLMQRVLDLQNDIFVRITGPLGGDESLFAWDGGYGSASQVEPPRLVISLGAAPPTPPPLPTQPVIVATVMDTPANVYTAAARKLTATAHATHYGTPTPLPRNAVTATLTPTPFVVTLTPTPANAATVTEIAAYATAVALTTGTFTPMPVNALIATVTPTAMVITTTPTPASVFTAAAQALTATAQATRVGTPTPWPANVVLIAGPPEIPVITFTPTPANTATFTANAAYATAVALTTGTFTPIPTNAVTPIIVLPSSVPENVMTAAAQLLTATTQAKIAGTATPLPFNAIMATTTSTPLVVTPTATPANGSTAVARAAYATAVALTTGTVTPPPSNMMTATPMPLMVYLDESTISDQPTPTPTQPTTLPSSLSGKILFLSDREGAGTETLFALDVATGRLARVTQDWPYSMARDVQYSSPDGGYSLLVQTHAGEEPGTRVPRVYVRDNQFGIVSLLQSTADWSYDPAWSPTGGQIAFVSQEPGNDEIFTVNHDGTSLQRLTTNDWSWDKHPTWSPDGTQIAFWSNRDTGQRQIWIMNADGSDQRRLMISAHNDWNPIWVR